MYGLILENLCQYIRKTYGSHKWDEVRKLAEISDSSFSIHSIYPDYYMRNLIDKACQMFDTDEKKFLINVGISFVGFIGQYGYDKVLSVLGREFRDFLNGLDDLHEYLRFSYPRLKPPSYFCDNENDNGLILHYRTKRNFLLWYTVGQIIEVGKTFYYTDVEIELLHEECDVDEMHFIIQLNFDNRAFKKYKKHNINSGKHENESVLSQIHSLPLSAKTFLQIFPFSIVFDENLMIKSIGNSLQVVCPHIVGSRMKMVFELIRPKIVFNWHSILRHTNNTFELKQITLIRKDYKKPKDFHDHQIETQRNNKQLVDEDEKAYKVNELKENNAQNLSLRLKGQMVYFEEWKCLVYLAAPNISSLEKLINTGLYLNDLSLHDFSRDMVLAGQQQSAELKLAFDQELHKSQQLEETIKKLDIEMKRSDELLYQMITDRLRNGEKSIETCQYFPSVTILFSDIINFTRICSDLPPMEVVAMLNAMYSQFDCLTEKHNVYKVETIGDAYMVAGGLPVHHNDDRYNHANKVCQMALNMIDVVHHVKDPSTGNSLNIRIGAVVGGIVGLKMPRYCLFGDTVNTASRIETSSEKQMVQISQMTKDLLDCNEWDIYERGCIKLKGKDKPMKTYWLYRKHFKHSTKNNKIIPENQCIIIDEINGNEDNNSNLHVTRNELVNPSAKPIKKKKKKRCHIL